MKEARRELQSALEVLLTRNLQKDAWQKAPMVQPHDTELQAKANKLTQYINAQLPLFDDVGRLVAGDTHFMAALISWLNRFKTSSCHPIVFVLDDNMPLRSMRQEYYKMARKCMWRQL